MTTVEPGRVLARSSAIVVTTPLMEWTAAQIASLRGDWDAATSAIRAASAVTADYENCVVALCSWPAVMRATSGPEGGRASRCPDNSAPIAVRSGVSGC